LYRHSPILSSVFKHHVMKVYRGHGCKAPHIVNLGICSVQMVYLRFMSLYSGEVAPNCNWIGGWFSLRAFWTLWCRQKSQHSYRELKHRTHSSNPITLLTVSMIQAVYTWFISVRSVSMLRCDFDKLCLILSKYINQS
jgi:hypothetical protein